MMQFPDWGVLGVMGPAKTTGQPSGGCQTVYRSKTEKGKRSSGMKKKSPLLAFMKKPG
jgi:hypothetical protein